MSSKIIVLPERLGIITIDKILSQAVDNNLNIKSKNIKYDLSELKSIDSTGITVFSNLIEWLLKKSVAQKFILPEVISAPIQFLDDSLFFKRYTGNLLNQKSKPRETTIPLKLVRHPSSHWWIEKECVEWLAKRLAINKGDLVELKICLQELFNNIRDHSGVETGCIFVQHYPERHKVVISMSDFGNGIPNNVRKVHPEYSDGEAVVKSLEEGFTTNSTVRNRGVGLYYLANTVSKNGGEVSIRTGNAHIIYSETGIADCSDRSGYYTGTLFEITLRTNRFDSSMAEEEDFSWE